MALLILPLPDDGPPGPGRLRQPRLRRLPRRFRVEHGPASDRKRDYFIGQRGWLDLLGSIPSLGLVTGNAGNAVALFRLARLSRLARITRLLRGQAGKDLVLDVLKNRGQYAAFITVLAAFIVLVTSSVLVLEFEVAAPGRQHHDRRRRVVVGRGDDHDRRLRRQVSRSPRSGA